MCSITSEEDISVLQKLEKGKKGIFKGLRDFISNTLVFSKKSCVCLSGLIIDAFGELRDQQEQVREDMEVRLNFKQPTSLFQLLDMILFLIKFPFSL